MLEYPNNGKSFVSLFLVCCVHEGIFFFFFFFFSFFFFFFLIILKYFIHFWRVWRWQAARV
jgi:hypothetical protein